MGRWIALLRGVNVGGNKRLPMAAFRETLAGLGFGDVATYIQSGNAVFSAEGPAEALAETIGRAIEARFGFSADVFVLDHGELARAIAENPFPQAQAEPKSLHLIFLADRDQRLDEDGMRALLAPGEDFARREGVLYLYTPRGFSKCQLAEKLPRFVTGSMTARNLRSAMAIADLAGEVAS